MSTNQQTIERIVGRYALYGEIATGGMARVHFGRLLGPVGFSRTVAVKRLHSHFAGDPEFVSMFLDEARLAGRIQHPNVVATLDVVALEGELFLVMEYVQGESLAQLLRKMRAVGAHVPLPIVCSVISGALHGLHAAHEARSERGTPLDIVHRDVSPQNVMVGSDGVARMLDFGVAKAAGRIQHTRDGELKGKLSYMSPEQLRGQPVDRRLDIYAAAVVLWECLAGRKAFGAENEGAVIASVLSGNLEPPSAFRADLPPQLDAIVRRGMEVDPADRYATAREFAIAIEDASPMASPRQVGDWVKGIAGKSLTARAQKVAEIESVSATIDLASLSLSPESKGSSAAAQASALPSRSPRARLASHPNAEEIASSSLSLGASSLMESADLHGVEPSKRRRRVALLGVVAAALLIAGGFALASTPAAPPALRRFDAALTFAQSLDPRPTAAPKPPEPTGATTTSAPATTTESRPPPTPSSKSIKPVGAMTSARPAPKSNCNPPFTIDRDGIRRPKPECL